MPMKGFHIGVRRTCAVIIGAVFFIAGLLKLIDPVGAGLVMDEYFRFFHVEFLSALAESSGVVAAMVETLLGAALVTGLWRRVVGIITLMALALLTILTLVLLIANPDMSCGCFGEALPLTHLQSFIKNVVLCALACVAFIPLQDDSKPREQKYVAFGLVAVFSVFLMVYSLKSIPVLDFTGYACGEELNEASFSFTDTFGEYADSTALEGRCLIVSVYEPEDLEPAGWGDVASSIDLALTNAVRPLLLVPYMDDVPVEFNEFLFFADRKTLMTLNRSNGGSTFASDGLVVRKWSRGGVPSDESFRDMVSGDPYDVMLENVSLRRMLCEGAVVLCFAIMLIF